MAGVYVSIIIGQNAWLRPYPRLCPLIRGNVHATRIYIYTYRSVKFMMKPANADRRRSASLINWNWRSSTDIPERKVVVPFIRHLSSLFGYAVVSRLVTTTYLPTVHLRRFVNTPIWRMRRMRKMRRRDNPTLTANAVSCHTRCGKANLPPIPSCFTLRCVHDVETP